MHATRAIERCLGLVTGMWIEGDRTRRQRPPTVHQSSLAGAAPSAPGVAGGGASGALRALRDVASAAGMTVVVVAAADSAGVAATGDPGVGETTFTTASTMACDASTTACALALAARVTR